MGFYDRLNVYKSHFLYMLSEGILNGTSSFSEDQMAFFTYAVSKLHDRKVTTKLMFGSIQNEMWGLLSFLLADNASFKGVNTTFLNNLDSIPAELKAPLLSILCYGYKWTDMKLNTVFLDTLEKNPYFIDEVKEMEDVITVYYPLGWNETIEEAINNPCWYVDEEDLFRYTMYSKMVYCIGGYDNEEKKFGNGELFGLNTVKSRFLIGRLKKKDILAVINPSTLYEDFLSQRNVIQNHTVYDVFIGDTLVMHDWEMNLVLDSVELNKEELDFDDVEETANLYYEGMLSACIKAGIPETCSEEEMQNRIIADPKELAMLLRVYVNIKKGDALKKAKGICKAQPNARWVLSSSPGYRMRKGYFYRGLFFSAYKNVFFPVIFRNDGNESYALFSPASIEEEFHGFYQLIATDFDTEARSYEECFAKCRKIAGIDQKPVKNTEYQIQYVKEEMSEEEKEKIRQQYRNEVDEAYQKEIHHHKTDAESRMSEIEVLKNRNADLLREVEDLKRQLDRKQRLLDMQNEISLLSSGKEKEKYDGEARSLVLSALYHEIRNCDKDTRRYDVLTDIIEKNADEDDLRRDRLKEIKNLTKGYRAASELKQDLIKCGFQYTEDGRHPKIQYPDDDRYIITIASTSSDRRAGDNLYALFKKKFF